MPIVKNPLPCRHESVTALGQTIYDIITIHRFIRSYVSQYIFLQLIPKHLHVYCEW